MNIPDNSYEESIIAAHSTPSLKRNTLTKFGKASQLAALKVPPYRVKEILDELYPEGK